MPVVTTAPTAPLPPTHCYVSLARGRTIRTFRLRVGVVRAGIGMVSLAACWLMASSLYLVFHDDLVAALMEREARTQYAYEDRIAALRGQVEREASAKLVGETTLDARLRDLTQRAASLETRASLLAQISARSGVGGEGRTIQPGSPPMAQAPSSGFGASATADTTGTLRAPLAGSGAGPTGPAKPHPDIEGRLATGMDVAALTAGAPFTIRLAGVEERLERIDASQFRSLGAVGAAARRRVDVLRSAIESAGLSPERLVSKAVASGLGGPFVPLDPSITQSAFGQALDAMQADLATASGLAQALPHIPFATPLSGPLEVTSPFGARLDPFMGRPAMHTGVDFGESYGTEVRATAAGRVVSAGPAGGYGTMIEVDHGHGLSTRYAHLSAVGVSPGQSVEKGEVIGEVGATGRATGPHLHYETRIAGEAVDPVRFLEAGARLAALDAGL